MEALLKLDHVTICYNGEPVVQDINLELNKGEILGVVGEPEVEKVPLLRRLWDFWEMKAWLRKVISGTWEGM